MSAIGGFLVSFDPTHCNADKKSTRGWYPVYSSEVVGLRGLSGVQLSGASLAGLYGPRKGKAVALSLRVTRAMELILEAFGFGLKASTLAWGIRFKSLVVIETKRSATEKDPQTKCCL